jgi:tetrahydromethanopterin S-methyltransferase subunit A
MTDELSVSGSLALESAAAELHHAAAAKKCWACGCLHGALETIERVQPAPERPAALAAAVAAARATLTPVRYDCLGCEICFPALAVNATHESRGDHVVAIIGMLQTENLGIERVIANILANPHVRFLVVGGTDSRQAIGHLPGQSLIALAREGIDAAGRIVGAPGKRPVLRNITREAVAHFRRTVEVIDLIGTTAVNTLMTAVRACAARQPSPAAPFASGSVVTPLTGYLPARMISDPAGYVVIYVDRPRHRLSLEHYRNEGLLDTVIEGATAAEVYTPAIERGLLSRLDHAAYVGCELARAEWALMVNEPYVQDGAPEGGVSPLPATPASCCGTSGGPLEAGSAHT